METVELFLWVVFAYLLYFNILASIVIYFDKGLTRFQRYAQSIIVWCVPLVGATWILHLLFKTSPKTIPRSWIPWPFKNLIYGPPIKSYDDAPPRRTGGWHGR